MTNRHSETLALYAKIDQTTDAHFKAHKRQAPCAKGCASCCSQFFEISDLEYALIIEFMKTLPKEKQAALGVKAETMLDVFKEHWPDFYRDYFSPETDKLHNNAYYQHIDRFKVMLPCVFLSPEGACEIYERRPIVCRTTGVGFQYLYNTGSVCNVIHHGLLTPLWQADLRPFKEAIDDVRWLPDETNELGVKRQYPMFFNVYKSSVIGKG